MPKRKQALEIPDIPILKGTLPAGWQRCNLCGGFFKDEQMTKSNTKACKPCWSAATVARGDNRWADRRDAEVKEKRQEVKDRQRFARWANRQELGGLISSVMRDADYLSEVEQERLARQSETEAFLLD